MKKDYRESRYLECFVNCITLYGIFKQGFHPAHYTFNQVRATACDFQCDIELKAKRVLPRLNYEQFLRVASYDPAEEQFKLIPEADQLLLGKAFYEAKFEDSRNYGSLFSLAKRNQRLDYINAQKHEREAQVEAEELLSDGPEGYKIVDPSTMTQENQ